MKIPFSNDEYTIAKELFKKISPYILLTLAESDLCKAQKYDKIMLRLEQEVDYDQSETDTTQDTHSIRE